MQIRIVTNVLKQASNRTWFLPYAENEKLTEIWENPLILHREMPTLERVEPTVDKWLRPGLRLTELPYPKWWGFWLRFIKTFEVLFFKVLQIMDLYRPQKWVVGIPSLATRHFTSLQAVVYNGTQDDVIGFRPKRMLHRILKGLPDLEAFESIRFQVALSERAVRSIEASTETRGFIHLQLPWQLPWVCPRQAWLRKTPAALRQHPRGNDWRLMSGATSTWTGHASNATT